MRQPDVGVGGRDHRQAGAVGDRDLAVRAARVERADLADHRGRVRVQLGVGGALGLVEDPGLRRRVVARLVADAQTPGAEAALAQHIGDRLAHLRRRERAAASQRHVRHDQSIGHPAAAVEHASAGRGGQRRAALRRIRGGGHRSAGGARDRHPYAGGANRDLARRVPEPDRGRHAVGLGVDARHRPAQAVERPYAPAPVGHVRHARADVDRALDEPRLRDRRATRCRHRAPPPRRRPRRRRSRSACWRRRGSACRRTPSRDRCAPATSRGRAPTRPRRRPPRRRR